MNKSNSSDIIYKKNKKCKLNINEKNDKKPIKNNVVNILLSQMLKKKKLTKLESKKLVKSLSTEIIYKSLIFDLKKELNYHKQYNSFLNDYLIYIKNLKDSFLLNKNKIEKYCSTFTNEFHDFLKLVDSKQNTLNELKIERKKIEKNLKYKKEDSFLLKKEFDKFNIKVNNNTNKLEKLKLIYQEKLSELNNGTKNFLENENKIEKKISILKQKYKQLEEFNEKLNKSIDNKLYDNSISNNIINSQNKKINLIEIKIKNMEMQKNIINLKNKINVLNINYNNNSNSIRYRNSKSVRNSNEQSYNSRFINKIPIKNIYDSKNSIEITCSGAITRSNSVLLHNNFALKKNNDNMYLININ